MNKLIFALVIGISTFAHAQSAPSQTQTASSTEVASAALPTSSAEVASAEASASAPETASAPANPHDPNAPTLGELQAPKESELEAANTELLATNAALEGRVAELTTQINLLVNERHAQFFLYGAFSTLFSFALGALAMWLVLSKKKDKW